MLLLCYVPTNVLYTTIEKKLSEYLQPQIPRFYTSYITITILCHYKTKKARPVLSHNTVRRLNCSTVTVGRSADVRTALLPYRRIPATKIHVYVLVRAQHRVLININPDGCFHTYIYRR